MEQLRIDPEFKSIIPPLSEDEFKQLEENILAEGAVLTAIVTWNGIIIDGHHRYKIIQKHPDIKYSVHKKEFNNRDEVIIWICKNQLGRRNLSKRQKDDLLGTRYNAEKRTNGASDGFRGNQHSNLVDCQIGNLPDSKTKSVKTTADRIAEEEGIGMRSVVRAGHVSSALLKGDKVSPGFRADVLTGKINPRQQDLIDIDCAAPEDIPKLVEALLNPKPIPQPIPPKPKRTRSSSDNDDIDRIVSVLVQEKNPVGEDAIIVTLRSAFETMESTCNRIFEQFPKLKVEASYREQVITIIQEPKKYIIDLERELNNA